MRQELRLWMALVLLLGMMTGPGWSQTLPATQTQPTKLLLWKVTGPGTEAYLLGSAHMASKTMYPLPEEIEAAFARCGALAVELDPDKVNLSALAGMMQQNGMYPAGQSLATALPADMYNTLRGVARDLGLDVAMLHPLKPWAVGLTLQVVAAEAAGLDPELGIDKHFIDLAKKTHKEVRELETADLQINALAGFNEALQLKWLAATLQEIGRMQEELKKLETAWTTGDTKAIEALAFEGDRKDPAMQKINATLIDARNVGMATHIDGYLKAPDKTPCFVVVGAAHLVGDKGVVQLLAAKGYRVEQMSSAGKPAPATTLPAAGR